MEEAEATRYWCHMCSQRVNPITEIDAVKCPICQSGFVEEMVSIPPGNESPLDIELEGTDSNRALPLWAPILLGMMENPRHRLRRRLRRMALEEEGGENEDALVNYRRQHNGETGLDRELESIMRRRRRSSATFLQLLQSMRAGILSDESGNSETSENDNRDRERVILINPFNQTIIVQGSYDTNDDSINRALVGSLGDYFVGPGLDLLLQHLSENDPNRYGTPPAQKEAVEALPTVKIEESLQCSVCLDECEIGGEVKEMPCKHKFHSRCILPWLELHSCCPVCRYQLPCNESKLDSEGLRNNSLNSNGENSNSDNDGSSGGDERNHRGRQFPSTLPWPFSSLFSSSSSRSSSSGNSSNQGEN